MLKIISSLVLFLLCSDSLARIGGDVGNGGDAVFCRANRNNSFAGFYSLDYLLKYDRQHLAVEVEELASSLDRIESGIKDKLPSLYDSFTEYRANLFNDSDFSKTHIWEKAEFGLIDLKDENFVSLLPANCRNGKRISIAQAVIRQPSKNSGLPDNKIIYKYFPKIVKELGNQNPLQLSFLLVHEWLWDFSQNVERNRKVNYWLHSSLLESWTREQWEKNLKGIGFESPTEKISVWDPEICLHDQENAEFIKSLKNYPITLFAAGQVHKRLSTCSRKKYCSEPIDVTEKFQLGFESGISIILKNFGLSVRATQPGQSLGEPIFSCTTIVSDVVNVKSCSWNPDGGSSNNKIELDMTIGKNCLTFRGQRKINEGRKSVIEDYVFFFPNLSFR